MKENRCISSFFSRELLILKKYLQESGQVGYWLNLIGKKVDFLTYSRETWFSISYKEVEGLIWLIEASNKIDRVSKFDNSLSFGAKQNALRQIFFALQFFKDLFMKNSNEIFFYFLRFCVGSIKKCIYVCLSMQIQQNMFMSTAAHL